MEQFEFTENQTRRNADERKAIEYNGKGTAKPRVKTGIQKWLAAAVLAAGFYRAHPHTAAFLQYVILPIEPLIERKGG